MPNLIVLDLKMPRKNGFEVLAWLRQRSEPGTLPVVVLSSSEEPSDVENAYNLGAVGYLVKPSSYLSYTQIVRTLNEFLVNGGEQQAPGGEARAAHRAINSRQVV
jgi:CheY-like chemotaxis protein